MTDNGKRAAVICPGPSVADCGVEIADCSLVIAVNRAVLQFGGDYWVVRDMHTLLEMDQQERKRLVKLLPETIVTSLLAYGHILRQLAAARGMKHIDPAVLKTPKRPIRWAIFSSTTAIVLAAELLATAGTEKSIECFGMDWKGQKDWDGHTSARNCRTEDRWTEEAKIFGQLQELLGARGIRVARAAATEVRNA